MPNYLNIVDRRSTGAVSRRWQGAASIATCMAMAIATAQAETALAADTAPDTAWEVIEGTQAPTGSRTITATLLSNEPINNMLDRPDHAALILRCQDNVFAAYIAWPQVLAMNGSSFGGRPQTMVLWRVDNRPIAANFWNRSDSGTATGMFETKPAAKLIEKLIVAKRLAVRLTGSTTQDASFTLADIQTVASRVGAPCGVTWTMKP